MKTRDEIEKLKAEWRQDQGWDLAETEGFEEHAAELGAYQAQVEAEQRSREAAKHKEAVARIVKPAMDLLAVVDTAPLLAHTPHATVKRAAVEIMLHAVAEMILPLQRQLERQREDIEAMQTRHDDELDVLRAQIRGSK